MPFERKFDRLPHRGYNTAVRTLSATLYPEGDFNAMKIIDAHLHLFSPEEPHAEELAQAAGHHNSTAHLRRAYGDLGIVHGVVMGNRSLDPAYHQYPADLFHYCVGLDSSLLADGQAVPDLSERVEQNLRRPGCCGVKLYPGYNRIPLSAPLYEPVYALATQYGKPVAVHMGLTANAGAQLKYCHPLALDEAAADHPQTRFVMCHFGNPFLDAAAAVMGKNPNVSADLSGLLEGRVDLSQYLLEQAGYVFLLRTWLAATGRWDSLLFGTDWPIVNLGEYIAFIQALVPERYWEQVFFQNANRVYGLGLDG